MSDTKNSNYSNPSIPLGQAATACQRSDDKETASDEHGLILQDNARSSSEYSQKLQEAQAMLALGAPLSVIAKTVGLKISEIISALQINER